MRKRLIVAVALSCSAGSLLYAQSISLQALPTQGAIAGENFILALSATSGVPPYTWQLVSGTLPPGCKLNVHTGRISGTPTTSGDYTFTVAVSDSNVPQSRAQRDFTVHVIEGLSLDWQDAPAVHGNNISGSAIVSNQTGHDMVLTVVVVAVNQIGRATALGYQHFTVSAGTKSPVIPFGASPGIGTYFVRADAAAHQTGHKRIYRTSKQSDASITLAQF
jgi:hypothetical protein